MAKTCPVCGGEYADSNAFCPNDGTTLVAAQPTGDLVGSVIADRYRVERLLGEGGMGRVYLARHVRLPQQAAIKVMHTATAHAEGAVARFNREAANAARIEHDRVARVFDFGEWGDGFVYLAMEYVPGQSLRHLLEGEGRLSPARAANITFQVAEGLDAAHRLGIVHRDLKPDNIMVVTDDQGVDRCKVVDFGIAKANDAVGTKLTSTGMIVGTPEFMSPEQIVGDAVDARSDVYALALTAFQMLTGALPFSGATPERILMARIMQPPAALAEVAPDVAWPEELQAAITAALQGEASERTESALAFADAMVAAVERWTGGPVLRGRTPMGMPAVTVRSPTPPAAPLPASGATGGRPVPASASAAGIATGGVAGGGAGQGARPSPSPSSGAAATGDGAEARTAPAGTRAGGLRLAIAAIVVVVVAAGGWYATSDRGESGTEPRATSSSTVGQEGAATAPNADGSKSTAAPGTGAPPQPSGAAERDRTPPAATPSSVNAAVAQGAGQPAAAPSRGTDPAATTREATSTPDVATGTGAGVASAAALAAKRELDSMRAVLASAESGEEEARAAIPRLQRVLRDLGTASDSTWAYLALVSAMGQAGEGQRACNHLRSARRLASSDLQLRAVQNFFASEALACVP
jgi:eukaryotic-like serine/threonine-protein kinase